MVSDGTLASLPLRLAVCSFSYRRVQSDNSPFHIVQGSSVGFHTRVLRTVPSPNQYGHPCYGQQALVYGLAVSRHMRRRLLYFDSSFVLWERAKIQDVFFCFGDNHFWEGECQVPPQERRTNGSWGVVICFRWGFLKECPFPSLQSGQNRGLISLELQSAPAFT